MNRYVISTLIMVAFILAVVVFWGEHLRRSENRTQSDPLPKGTSLFDDFLVPEQNQADQKALLTMLIKNSPDCELLDTLLDAARRSRSFDFLDTLILQALPSEREAICCQLLSAELEIEKKELNKASEILARLQLEAPENLDVLQKVADLAYKQGQYDKAEVLGSKIMDLAERTHDEHRLARAFGNQAAVFAMKQHYKRALELQDKALAIHETRGNQDGILKDRYNRASIRLMIRDETGALEDYERALSLSYELTRPIMTVTILNRMVTVLRRSGNHTRADLLWNQCQSLLEKLRRDYLTETERHSAELTKTSVAPLQGN